MESGTGVEAGPGHFFLGAAEKNWGCFSIFLLHEAGGSSITGDLSGSEATSF